MLASLCFKKDYANFDFDLSKYLQNPSFKNLYETLKQYHNENKPFRISNLYDNDEKIDEALGEILDYNFEDINDPDKYFKECDKYCRLHGEQYCDPAGRPGRDRRVSL